MAGELEEIAAKTPLGRVWVDFAGKKRKRENEKLENKKKKKGENGKRRNR